MLLFCRNIFLLLLPIFLFFKSNAQDSPAAIKEIGFGTNNFDNFSIQFRWGNEEKLKRISGNLDFDGRLDPVIENNGYDSQLGFHFSSFKLLPLKEKIGWFYGWKAGINASFDHSKNYEGTNVVYRNSSRISPRVGGILGIYYKFTPELFLYGELNPNIYYRYTINTTKRTGPSIPEQKSKST